jgi:serine/threonine protein kinase
MSEKLHDLLLRWEELRQAGKAVSVDELCHDCPELRDQLLAQAAALEKMHRILDLKGSGTNCDDLRPGWEIHGYRLERRLGKGGFGEVWKASGPGGFHVALKFVSLHGRLGSAELRSLEVLKKLRHPNLLSTFAAWPLEDTLVIGMDLADETLLDRLTRAQKEDSQGIPFEELIRYMAGAAEGIDYLNTAHHHLRANQQDVAVQHRDIKPQNLLLAGGGVKVADFGLLQVLDKRDMSHSGSLTLAYAPPEFCEGKTARTSDQYSLAVTYCQLRGGRLPFTGTPSQVLEGHCRRPPDLTMLPEQEQAAVARALAKSPDDRWPSCRKFVEALAGSIREPGDSNSAPTPVKPPKPGPSPWRFLLKVAFGRKGCMVTCSLGALLLAVAFLSGNLGLDLSSPFKPQAAREQPASPSAYSSKPRDTEKSTGSSAADVSKLDEAIRKGKSLIESEATAIKVAAHPTSVANGTLEYQTIKKDDSGFKLRFDLTWTVLNPVKTELFFVFASDGTFVKCVPGDTTSLIPPFKGSSASVHQLGQLTLGLLKEDSKLTQQATQLIQNADVQQLLDLYLRLCQHKQVDTPRKGGR